MPGRPMNAATSTALEDSVLYPAWILRLDIEDDPVYVWTGIGDLSFVNGAVDLAMDGLVFEGIGNVGEIGTVSDAAGGSGPLKLTLPGVDPNDDVLKQIVYDFRRWQFRQAYLWLALMDANGNLIGDPVRVKTGRMDQMVLEDEDSGEGKVIVTIEGHMAWAGEALNTRYSEQREVDPTDTSQDWVHDLANKTAHIKESDKNSPPAKTGNPYKDAVAQVAWQAQQGQANGAMRRT